MQSLLAHPVVVVEAVREEVDTVDAGRDRATGSDRVEHRGAVGGEAVRSEATRRETRDARVGRPDVGAARDPDQHGAGAGRDPAEAEDRRRAAHGVELDRVGIRCGGPEVDDAVPGGVDDSGEGHGHGDGPAGPGVEVGPATEGRRIRRKESGRGGESRVAGTEGDAAVRLDEDRREGPAVQRDAADRDGGLGVVGGRPRGRRGGRYEGERVQLGGLAERETLAPD